MTAEQIQAALEALKDLTNDNGRQTIHTLQEGLKPYLVAKEPEQAGNEPEKQPEHVVEAPQPEPEAVEEVAEETAQVPEDQDDLEDLGAQEQLQAEALKLAPKTRKKKK